MTPRLGGVVGHVGRVGLRRHELQLRRHDQGLHRIQLRARRRGGVVRHGLCEHIALALHLVRRGARRYRGRDGEGIKHEEGAIKNSLAAGAAVVASCVGGVETCIRADVRRRASAWRYNAEAGGGALDDVLRREEQVRVERHRRRRERERGVCAALSAIFNADARVRQDVREDHVAEFAARALAHAHHRVAHARREAAGALEGAVEGRERAAARRAREPQIAHGAEHRKQEQALSLHCFEGPALGDEMRANPLVSVRCAASSSGARTRASCDAHLLRHDLFTVSWCLLGRSASSGSQPFRSEL